MTERKNKIYINNNLFNNLLRNIFVQIKTKSVLRNNFTDKLESIAHRGSTCSYDDWDQYQGMEDLIRVNILEALYVDSKILVYHRETDAHDYLCDLYTIKKNAPEGTPFFEIEYGKIRLKNRGYLNLGFHTRSKSGTPSIWGVNNWLDYVNSLI